MKEGSPLRTDVTGDGKQFSAGKVMYKLIYMSIGNPKYRISVVIHHWKTLIV